MDKYTKTVESTKRNKIKKVYPDPAPKRKLNIKFRTIPRIKYKNELLREYIKNTTFIHREDMDKMGYCHVQSALTKYAKFNNIKIIPVDYYTWEIVI